jgi:hypothetical protein
MGVKGSLQDMSLTSLISVNCNERNQAHLSITRQGVQAHLYFFDGRIVHATCDSLQGDQAIYQLVTWNDGEFELETGVSQAEQTVSPDWSGVLLEGMRRLDEGNLSQGIWNETAQEPLGASAPLQDDTADRMARGLVRIPGIDQAVVCSSDGQLQGCDATHSPMAFSALVAFTAQRAVILGALLNAGAWVRIDLTGEQHKMMFVPNANQYVGLVLSSQETAESLVPTVLSTVHRYRNV